LAEKFEPVDRQPYVAEITDQGTSETKSGTPIVKLYFRLLGKAGNSPDGIVDAFKVGERPEVEMSIFLNPDDQYCGFRTRDLVENLGWDPEKGIEALDPRTKGFLNVVGKKLTIAPNLKGDKVYWNFTRQERKLKRFIGDKPVENLKAKSPGVLQKYLELKNKKNDGVPQEAVAAGEPIPF